MPFCPNCGKEVQEDNQFCPACGRNLKQAQPTSQPITGQAYYGGVDPDASAARMLTLIAIILGAIFFIVGLFVSMFVLFGTSFFMGAPLMVVGFFPMMFGFGFLISILWIALDYFLVYRNLFSSNDIPNARTPALVLGVMQLIFGGVIPGILLIIAYVKIGDSMRRRGQAY
ncbi:MAG: zinc-ribbon domain-containing protein [Nitrososphaerota archaeon]|nr:zinc-ribbon domain-containing protein [Nitrososphaerota archaeon]